MVLIAKFYCTTLGRNLDGIHFAMTFLETWQKKQHGNELEYLKWYAKDKDVVVIGGGDTGCDCIATSLRQVTGHIAFQSEFYTALRIVLLTNLDARIYLVQYFQCSQIKEVPY